MLDGTDRRIITELRRDGRASVSTLAARLSLSRATVKSRIDRLVANRTIERFTVELNTAEALEAVRAIVLIRLEGSMSRAVIRSLAGLGEIVRLNSTNGVWDLVAELECASLQHFDMSLRRVREIDGVTNSESCLAARHSRVERVSGWVRPRLEHFRINLVHILSW